MWRAKSAWAQAPMIRTMLAAHRGIGAIAALMMASIFAACERDSESPLDPDVRISDAAASQQQPFYYHQREPVRLRVDPSRLVVATNLPSPDIAIAAALSEFGLDVESVEPMIQAARHSLVRLSSATTAAAATEVVTQLRQARTFDFVSNVYRTVEGNNEVMLLDRVSVRFRNGVTVDQVESVIAAFGLRIVRNPRPELGLVTYWLGYSADADPLEVAAALYGHPLVQWATPDFVTDARLGSPTDPFYVNSLQYYLKNTRTRNGIPVDINVEPAWNLSVGYYTITVAVIDDGVEPGGPDLGNVQGSGWDAFGRDCATFPDCESNPTDNDSHGTHVAGIINA